MGMGTRLYPLPDGDGDETKIWYLLPTELFQPSYYKKKYYTFCERS